MDEKIKEWRKMHNEELYILYSSPNIIKSLPVTGRESP
jgi:hypothetical protein